MESNWEAVQRRSLEAKKAELTQRLERITANVRRSLASDSEERAKELEDREVVEALGNEARAEIKKIDRAIERLENGDFDRCTSCGDSIGEGRFRAHPYALQCINCAELDEEIRARA